MMTLLCALILLPIIFTFLYSFFPKGEITSFLNQRNKKARGSLLAEREFLSFFIARDLKRARLSPNKPFDRIAD